MLIRNRTVDRFSVTGSDLPEGITITVDCQRSSYVPDHGSGLVRFSRRRCSSTKSVSKVKKMAFDTVLQPGLWSRQSLVMLMTRGRVFLWRIGRRRRIFISMIALSFVVLALVSIHWMLIGYPSHLVRILAELSATSIMLGPNGVSADAGGNGILHCVYGVPLFSQQ